MERKTLYATKTATNTKLVIAVFLMFGAGMLALASAPLSDFWSGAIDPDATSTFDTNQLFIKSTTQYNGGSKTDYCYTLPTTQKTYLMEGINKNGVFSTWHKNCTELDNNVSGKKYQCIDGACVNVNAPVLGAQKTAVILFNYEDCQAEPQTKDDVLFKYFNSSNTSSMNSLIKEISFNKTWFEPEILGYYTLPIKASACAPYVSLGNESSNNALIGFFDDYVDYSKYDNFILMLPPECGCEGGWGTLFKNVPTNEGILNLKVVSWSLASSTSPTQDFFNSKGMLHEWGHTRKLRHTPLLDCGTNIVGNLGEGCSMVDRGNWFDLMAKPTLGHFNAAYKDYLGWLSSGNTLTVNTSSQQILEPIEKKTNGVQMIKIPAKYKVWDSADPSIFNGGLYTNAFSGVYYSDNYFLEFRKNIGIDNTGFNNSVVIYLNSYQMPYKYSFTLNPSPTETNKRYKQSLRLGQTFSDPNLGLSVTFLSETSTGAILNIQFSK